MAYLPALLSGTIFKSVEKAFNSPEHNFKSDLDGALRQAGVTDAIRQRILQLLNTGSDGEIGKKLNALMAAGVIPPEMAAGIKKLASNNGVSANSINPADIGSEMDASDCRSIIGGAFPDEVDAMDDDEFGDEDDDEDSGEDDDS